jgi:hypothetical protein
MAGGRVFTPIFWSPRRGHTKKGFSPSGSSLSLTLIFIPTPGGTHLDLNQEEDVALFYVLQPDSYFLRLIYGNWFDFVLC